MPDEPAQEPEDVVDPIVEPDPVVDPAPSPAPAPPPAEPVDTGYTAGGVPTFDSVREKIETRYGTAIGSAELDAETPEGRSVEEQYDSYCSSTERPSGVSASSSAEPIAVP